MNTIGKIGTVIASLLLAANLRGDGAAPTAAEKAAMRERLLANTGGFVIKPGSGPAIVALDLREAPDSAPAKVKAVFDDFYRQPFEIVTPGPTNASPVKVAARTLEAAKALLVVAVADDVDVGVPAALLVMPEQRIAVINAGQLACPDKERQEIRVVKELWRAIGLLQGVGYSRQENSVMQPVSTLEELDALVWQVIPPAEYIQAHKMQEKHGVVLGKKTSYRKACKEGWAPAPTNDIQKAVWNRVKAEKAAATNAPAAKAAAPTPAK